MDSIHSKASNQPSSLPSTSTTKKTKESEVIADIAKVLKLPAEGFEELSPPLKTSKKYDRTSYLDSTETKGSCTEFINNSKKGDDIYLSGQKIYKGKKALSIDTDPAVFHRLALVASNLASNIGTIEQSFSICAKQANIKKVILYNWEKNSPYPKAIDQSHFIVQSELVIPSGTTLSKDQQQVFHLALISLYRASRKVAEILEEFENQDQPEHLRMLMISYLNMWDLYAIVNELLFHDNLQDAIIKVPSSDGEVVHSYDMLCYEALLLTYSLNLTIVNNYDANLKDNEYAQFLQEADQLKEMTAWLLEENFFNLEIQAILEKEILKTFCAAFRYFNLTPERLISLTSLVNVNPDNIRNQFWYFMSQSAKRVQQNYDLEDNKMTLKISTSPFLGLIELAGIYTKYMLGNGQRFSFAPILKNFISAQEASQFFEEATKVKEQIQDFERFLYNLLLNKEDDPITSSLTCEQLFALYYELIPNTNKTMIYFLCHFLHDLASLCESVDDYSSALNYLHIIRDHYAEYYPEDIDLLNEKIQRLGYYENDDHRYLDFLRESLQESSTSKTDGTPSHILKMKEQIADSQARQQKKKTQSLKGKEKETSQPSSTTTSDFQLQAWQIPTPPSQPTRTQLAKGKGKAPAQIEEEAHIRQGSSMLQEIAPAHPVPVHERTVIEMNKKQSDLLEELLNSANGSLKADRNEIHQLFVALGCSVKQSKGSHEVMRINSLDFILYKNEPLGFLPLITMGNQTRLLLSHWDTRYDGHIPPRLHNKIKKMLTVIISTNEVRLHDNSILRHNSDS